jgi:hypothetical protein
MKNSFQVGLEHILNNKETNFLKSPHIFNEIHKSSGMSVTSIMKHIGRTKAAEKQNKGPSEKEKSEQRLKELEAKSTH